MSDWADRLGGFIPHGYCYSWDPGLLWIHVMSDAIIAGSYFAIPFYLWTFAKRRKDLGFKSLFVMFGIFILGCGMTHVMGIWTIWHADFWADGVIKAGTAAVSLATALALWPLMPKALALPTPGDLRRVNSELRAEVDARKRAEEELKRVNHELKAQIAELEAFSYAVSHDLRAPLRHVDGFSSILIDEYGKKLDERAQRYLSRISESSRYLGKLVDDLLAFSRAGRSALKPEPTDTRRLIEEVLEELAPDMEGRRIEVRVGALPMVYADPVLLRLVFMNLIGNAIKYSRTRDPACIEIGRAADENNQIVLFVRDNGVGFDMRYAHKLFGVFQRLHQASEFEGTGIGLANVRRIVQRHGGRVWAESVEDQGASFYFSLYPVSHFTHHAAASEPISASGEDLGSTLARHPAG